MRTCILYVCVRACMDWYVWYGSKKGIVVNFCKLLLMNRVTNEFTNTVMNRMMSL